MAYSEEEKTEIIDSVCEKIRKGVSVRTCLQSDDTPATDIFFKWIDRDEIKAKQYARALAFRAEWMFEDLISIADNQEGDKIIVDGKEVVNHNEINRARLRVDTRKWMLSKLMPKKYGDKIEVEEVKRTIKEVHLVQASKYMELNKDAS